MAKSLDELFQHLQDIQDELEQRLDEILSQKREEFRYQLQQGKVHFQREIRALHRAQRIGIPQYILRARVRHILSAPIIYSVIIPLVLMDIFVSFYQATCFRLYGIPRVKRSDHIILDRHKLDYLNGLEKLNCLYCGYGNGLISYFREIFARTEQYWCPIKHAQRTFAMHGRTEKFADYGDARTYRQQLQKLRTDWGDNP